MILWDVEKRESVWEYMHHTGRVEAVAFNSMRDMVATAGADGRVCLLFADSGKQVWHCAAQHSTPRGAPCW